MPNLKEAFLELVARRLNENERCHFLGIEVSRHQLSIANATDRICDMPIAEESILGVALGMARSGSEVFVDLMFAAFAFRTMDVLVNQFALSALLPTRTAPLVVRMICGPFPGAGPQHGSAGYALLARIPNVLVAAPCLASDVTKAYDCATRECKPLLLLIGRDLDVQSEQMLHQADSDIHLFGTGTSLCIICWGIHASIVLRAVSAAGAWESTRVLTTLMLSPMPIESLLDGASSAEQLLILDVSAPPTTIGDLLLARAYRRNSWRQILHEVLPHEDESDDEGDCVKSVAMLISGLTHKPKLESGSLTGPPEGAEALNRELGSRRDRS